MRRQQSVCSHVMFSGLRKADGLYAEPRWKQLVQSAISKSVQRKKRLFIVLLTGPLTLPRRSAVYAADFLSLE